MIKQPAIYLDLDDVMADWNREAVRYLNQPIADGYALGQDDWKRLTDHRRFYRDLPLLPGATELVTWARDYATRTNRFLAFLTAIPHDNSVQYAAYDKALWCYERFPDIPMFIGPYSYDKKLHCKPGDILIDDRHENCTDWSAAGGLACRYTGWEDCKKWIKKVLKEDAV